MAYIDKNGVIHDDGCFKDIPRRDKPKCEQCKRAVCGLITVDGELLCGDCINKILAAAKAEIERLKCENEDLRAQVTTGETGQAILLQGNAALKARVEELEGLLRHFKKAAIHATEAFAEGVVSGRPRKEDIEPVLCASGHITRTMKKLGLWDETTVSPSEYCVLGLSDIDCRMGLCSHYHKALAPQPKKETPQ